jgi:hypothetical protein
MLSGPNEQLKLMKGQQEKKIEPRLKLEQKEQFNSNRQGYNNKFKDKEDFKKKPKQKKLNLNLLLKNKKN